MKNAALSLIFFMVASASVADPVALNDPQFTSSARAVSDICPELVGAYDTTSYNNSVLCFGPTGYAKTDIIMSFAPSISSHSFVASTLLLADPLYTWGKSSLTYQVMVIGPDTGNLIPIGFNAYLYASVNTDMRAFGSSSAALELQGAGLIGSDGNIGSNWSFVAAADEGPYPFVSYNVEQMVQTLPNEPINVKLSTYTNVRGVTGGNGGVNAYADPYFYVDPAYENASLYQILVSPGVENSPLSQ